MATKEQCMQENSETGESEKVTQKCGALLFIGNKKPRHSKGHTAWQCFPKPNEETHHLTTSLD